MNRIFLARHLSVILSFALLFSFCAGCSRPKSDYEKNPSSEMIYAKIEEDTGLFNINDLSAERSIVRADTTTTEYVQTYKGVPIYNVSILSAEGKDAEEFYSIGTYVADIEEQMQEGNNLVAFQKIIQNDYSIVNDIFATIRANGLNVIECYSYSPYLWLFEDGSVHPAAAISVSLQFETDIEKVTMIVDAVNGSLLDYYMDWCNYSREIVTIPVKGKSYSFKIMNDSAMIRSNDSHLLMADTPESINQKNFKDYLYQDNVYAINVHSIDNLNQYQKTVLNAYSVSSSIAEYFDDALLINGYDNNGSDISVIVLNGEIGGIAVNYYNQQTGKDSIVLGNNVSVAPEIVAHEYAHAILMSQIGFFSRNSQIAALNESIADIMGACYIKSADWILGKNVAAKNLANPNRITMSDYDNGGADKLTRLIYDWLNIDIGEPHDNSTIVSNCVYRIWRDAFDKDYTMLEQIMQMSLSYLPKNPNFNNFGAAFCQAASNLYGAEVAGVVEEYFESIGIECEAGKISTVSKNWEPNNSPQSLSVQIPDGTYNYALVTEIVDGKTLRGYTREWHLFSEYGGVCFDDCLGDIPDYNCYPEGRIPVRLLDLSIKGNKYILTGSYLYDDNSDFCLSFDPTDTISIWHFFDLPISNNCSCCDQRIDIDYPEPVRLTDVVSYVAEELAYSEEYNSYYCYPSVYISINVQDGKIAEITIPYMP